MNVRVILVNVPGAVIGSSWVRCLVLPRPSGAWESGLGFFEELGDVFSGGVDDAAQSDHDVHDGGGAANFKERALGLSFPVDEVFSHERLPLAHS